VITVLRESDAPLSDGEFARLLDNSLRAQGIHAPCAVTLTLTDEASIRDVNRAHRGVDRPTDVLSFPAALLPARPGAPLPPSMWDSGAGAFFLGDIVISCPRALAQAKEYGHPPEREFSYLFVHGVFHLLGYDHQNEEERHLMRKKEEEALGGPDGALAEAAFKAREAAYVPYSGYRVGAALRDRAGRVFTGCNVENVSYGLTNCAERTALFKAVSEGAREFDAIAIAAEGTAPWPCGACRQVLSEFAPGLRVLVAWEGGREETTLEALLPHSFLRFEGDKKHGQ